MSYHAGANFPQFIVEEYLMDKTINYTEDWRNNTLLLRYDSEVIVYDV